MKNIGSKLTLFLTLGATCVGSPLKKEEVAADAKWLMHVDVDKLRTTKVGEYLMQQVLGSKLNELTRQFDFDLDWNKVSSLTAYGTDYGSKRDFDGVVLIRTDLDLRKPLDAAVEKMSKEDGKKPASVSKTQEGPVTTYSMKDSLFVSFQPGSPVIVGKSLNSIEKASGVLSGKSANLASTKTFSEYSKSQKAFFFLGAVEVFDPTQEPAGQSHDGEEFNPKAKILKLADGGRVILGEDSNELFLDLSLKAKSADVVTQIQQVVQGMIALAALSQSNNQDLQQLAQSAKVSSAGKIVSLKLGYPADQAVLMLSSNLNRHLENKQSAENNDEPQKKPKSKHHKVRHEPAKPDDNKSDDIKPDDSKPEAQ